MNRVVIYVLLFTCIAGQSFSQVFKRLHSEKLSDLVIRVTASADLNNDGQFEFLVSGKRSGEIIQYLIHNEEGNSILVENPFAGASNGDFLFEDFDKDGLLDVLITKGSDISGPANIYLNKGGFRFELTQEFLDEENEIRLGYLVDFDNDGQKEILSWGGVIFKNEDLKSASFIIDQILNSEINKFSYTNFTHFDLNNDGYEDVVYFQARTNGDHELFLNDKNGGFKRESFFNEDTNVSSIIPVDINSDGLNELSVLEEINGEFRIVFYSYSENGFTINSNMTINVMGSSYNLIYVDFDQDGDIDVFQAGFWNGHKLVHRLYRNESNLSFSKEEDFEFDSSVGLTAVGDFNNDMDLDIFSNFVGDSTGLLILENETNNLNESPRAPDQLVSQPEGSGVRLSWSLSTDKESPSKSLTYNVYIRNSDTGDYFLRPLVNDTRQTLLTQGNFGTKNNSVINCLPNGLYDWGVQAIDPTYGTSNFVSGQSFLIEREAPLPPSGLRVSRVSDSFVELAWSDESNNESNYVIFRKISGEPEYPKTPLATLAENSNSFLDESVDPGISYEYKVVAFSCRFESQFSSVTTLTRLSVFTLAGAYQVEGLGEIVGFEGFDIENDGLMDLVMLGPSNVQMIFKNQGELKFDQQSRFLDKRIYGRLQVADLDQDNQMDLMVYQVPRNSKRDFPGLIKNNGDGTFTNFFEGESSELPSNSLTLTDFYNDGMFEIVQVSSNRIGLWQILSLKEAAYWPQKELDLIGQGIITGHKVIDLNGDGLKDILVFRLDAIEVHTNLGGLNFDSDLISAPDQFQVQLVADIDGDDWIDILVKKVNISADLPLVIYTFKEGRIEVQETKIPGSFPLIKYIDIDNDGLLDIIHGSVRDFDLQENFLRVFRNLGDWEFELYASVQLPMLSGHKIMVWDFDKDGDVDVAVLGEHLRGGEELYLYKNNLVENDGNMANQKPISSNSITIEVDDEISLVKVSWQPGSDFETAQDKLKYAVSIENKDGGLVYSSGITTLGELLTIEFDANELLETSFNCIRNGDFVLYVQSIDSGGSASERGEGVSFSVSAIKPLPVAEFEAKTVSDRVIELSWKDESEGEKEYRIFKKSKSVEDFSLIPFAVLAENSESFIDTLNAPDSEYDYRIVAFNCAFDQEFVSASAKTFPLLFKEVTFPTFSNGIRAFHSDLGDYDNDGDEDLVVVYRSSTLGDRLEVLENIGGDWIRTPNQFDGFEDSGAGVAWVDFNGDGFLDFTAMGMSSTGPSGLPIFAFYENNKEGEFERISVQVLNWPNLFMRNEKPIWADFDHDGDLDFTIKISRGGSGFSFAQFVNDDGRFLEKEVIDIGTISGRMPYADYDNDGDLDLVVLEKDFRTAIYENDGFGVFTKALTPKLDLVPGVKNFEDNKTAWADVNADGFLDLIVAGDFPSIVGGSLRFGLVLINDQNRDFNFDSEPIGYGGGENLDFGDFDHDGDLDFFVFGDQAKIFENLGEGRFNLMQTTPLPNARSRARMEALVSDIDKDGDLDLLIFGEKSFGNINMFQFDNVVSDQWFRPNLTPSTPLNVRVEVVVGGIILEWDDSIDDITPSELLRYHVIVKNAETGEYLTPPFQSEFGKTITELPLFAFGKKAFFRNSSDAQILTVQVQAIDASDLASEPSRELILNVVTDLEEDVFDNFTVYPNPNKGDRFNISYEDNYIGTVQFLLIDQSGKVVLQKTTEKVESTLRYELIAKDILPGVYLLRKMDSQSTRTIKLLKF